MAAALKITVSLEATPQQWRAVILDLAGATGPSSVLRDRIKTQVVDALKETRRIRLQEKAVAETEAARLADIDTQIGDIDTALPDFET